MKRIVFAGILGLVIGLSAFGADDGLQLKLTADPALPLRDYLNGIGSFEGENPLAGFKFRKGRKYSTVVPGGANSSAHAVKIDGPHDCGLLIWPLKLPVGKEVRVSLYVNGAFGLHCRPGLGLGYEIVGVQGKKQVSLAHEYYVPPPGKNPKEWHKLVSPAVKVSGPWYLVVRNFYASGGGLVDEIRVTDASVTLTAAASSEAGVREVIVRDDNGTEVFNSGILPEGRKTFTKSLTVASGCVYTATADDYDGDVKKITYPETK